MRTNKRKKANRMYNFRAAPAPAVTHGGGIGTREYAPVDALLRQVSTCLLGEKTFYSNSVASDIDAAARAVSPSDLASVAVIARNEMHMRHVPLLLLAILDERRSYEANFPPGLVRNVIPSVVKRADEMAELIAVICDRNETEDAKSVISHQISRGIRDAFESFGAYALAKYRSSDSEISLRDVMFLVHPSAARAAWKSNGKLSADAARDLYTSIADGTAKAPITWESLLSSGADRRSAWTELLEDGRLGGLALLRNLRNMVDCGVRPSLVRKAIAENSFDRVLPFRFVTAAIHAPEYKAELSNAMVSSVKARGSFLPGVTVVVVDVSGSMGGVISGNSEVNRIHASAALAAIIRESGEKVHVYATAGSDSRRVHATKAIDPLASGLNLVEAIYPNAYNKLGHGGIFLTQVMNYVGSDMRNAGEIVDRVIVITDEQDCDTDPNRSTSKAPLVGRRNYIINVAPYAVGLGVDEKNGWSRINGFSESAVDYIHWAEKF